MNSMNNLIEPDNCSLLRQIVEGAKLLFDFINHKNLAVYFLSDTDSSGVPIRTNFCDSVDDLIAIIFAHIQDNFIKEAPDCPHGVPGKLVLHINDLLSNDIGHNQKATLQFIMAQTKIKNPHGLLKYFSFCWEQATKEGFQEKLQTTPQSKALQLLDSHHYWKVCGLKEPTEKINEPYKIFSIFIDNSIE